MDFNNIANQVIGSDDDYEEYGEKVNTDTTRLIKKRRLEYRGV